jgi:hypothetical protein
VKSLADILIAAEHASEGERAAVLSILGRSFSYRSFAFVAREGSCIEPVAAPVYFEPTCASRLPGPPPIDEFSMTFDSCSRLGCERTRVGLVDVWLTVQPRTAADDRHRFEYPATSPVGRMTYDPNPYVTYRIDLTDPVVTTVSADLRQTVIFTPAEGSPLDISHTGTVMATKQDGTVRSASLVVFFAGLTPPASPVVLNLDGGPSGEVMGAVRFGTRVLAMIQGHFDPAARLLSWQGACA